ncbi:class I SAM-dependent methyltransferase [Virgisporangium aliadipatigenens]|nr:class I SAM-dependent methyltransferase [Virgisporangium aliadipatigenens]
MTTSISATVHCVLCGPRPHRPLLDGTVQQCVSCGFGRTTAELPSPARLYAELPEEDDDLRRLVADRRLRRITAVARPATLLEAGCAEGHFVVAARRAGIDASGIDVSREAARYANEMMGAPVRHGYFETLAATVDEVDVVCAFDVLPDVENPREFLEVARGAVAPGGWLCLEVPNIASAAAGRQGAAWPAWAPDVHRWHFSPETLIGLVVDCGFRVVDCDTVFERFYRPRGHRIRHARRLFLSDWVSAGTRSMSHPRLGDRIRLLARRYDEGMPLPTD